MPPRRNERAGVRVNAAAVRVQCVEYTLVTPIEWRFRVLAGIESTLRSREPPQILIPPWLSILLPAIQVKMERRLLNDRGVVSVVAIFFFLVG